MRSSVSLLLQRGIIKLKATRPPAVSLLRIVLKIGPDVACRHLRRAQAVQAGIETPDIQVAPQLQLLLQEHQRQHQKLMLRQAHPQATCKVALEVVPILHGRDVQHRRLQIEAKIAKKANSPAQHRPAPAAGIVTPLQRLQHPRGQALLILWADPPGCQIQHRPQQNPQFIYLNPLLIVFPMSVLISLPKMKNV